MMRSPTPWMGFVAAILCGYLLTLSPAAAGTADDPEVVDPQGDVRLDGVVPLPAGAEWADVLALWYEEPRPGEVVMRIRLFEAEAIPPGGEVAAHIEIAGVHSVAGFTTVLPPFSVPMYQGGFRCLSDAERNVDPADCAVLADVGLAGNILTVPLPADVFGLAPDTVIETITAYSGAWYLDVTTVLDETDPGRAYRTQALAAPMPEAGETDPEPATPPSGPRTTTPPPETGTAPLAPLGALVALLALLGAARGSRFRAAENGKF